MLYSNSLLVIYTKSFKDGNISSLGFPGGLDSKESTCNEGDLGSVPGLGRSSGEGNGYPFQYSCLENSMDRGAQKVKEMDRTEQLTLPLSFYL